MSQLTSGPPAWSAAATYAASCTEIVCSSASFAARLSKAVLHGMTPPSPEIRSIASSKGALGAMCLERPLLSVRLSACPADAAASHLKGFNIDLVLWASCGALHLDEVLERCDAHGISVEIDDVGVAT
jgi:hypothetical protein